MRLISNGGLEAIIVMIEELLKKDVISEGDGESAIAHLKELLTGPSEEEA